MFQLKTSCTVANNINLVTIAILLKLLVVLLSLVVGLQNEMRVPDYKNNKNTVIWQQMDVVRATLNPKPLWKQIKTLDLPLSPSRSSLTI